LGSVISSDGSIVATAMPDHVVRVFDVDRRAARRVDLEMPGGPAALYVAPGGEYAAYLTAEWPEAAVARVRVVDVAEGEQLPYTVVLEPSMAFDARFSGDGRTLVTADDAVVVARDAATGRRATGTDRYRARDPAAFLGVDQDGRRVAMSETTGDVEVADMTTGQQLAVLDPTPESDAATSSLQHLTFSPDGTWLAAGSDSGVVVVWDTRTWDEQASWRVSGGAVQSLAFTADSRSLVVGGGGAASIRDVANPRVPLATVDLDPLRTEAHVSVASREDGRVLVTHTDHSGLQLWRIGAAAMLTHACRVAGRDLTEEEWAAGLPDRPYAPTCP
jgi:WD40 repeat protein